MANVSVFGPDFPFAYDNWIRHPEGLGTLPKVSHGTEIAIIGAGVSGLIAAYELMKLGLKPVVYETGRIGGRLRSEHFENAKPPRSTTTPNSSTSKPDRFQTH